MYPLISIIIPLYNKATTVEHSVHSVLNQLFRDFELIIVDDGSTDNSLDIVKKIQDERMVIIEQENGGPSKARNMGVRYAKGDWVLFLDADDELLLESLQIFSELTDRYNDADIIDCNRYIHNKRECSLTYHPIEGLVENPMRSWFFREIMPSCGNTIFKSILVQDYPFDENLRRYEDVELLFRLLPISKVYSSISPTCIHYIDYAAASKPCKSIAQDFMGHLCFGVSDFWYRMNMYRFYLEERNNYPNIMPQLYLSINRRYDWLLIYKSLGILYQIKRLFHL